jgi:hypothetical protein
MEPVGLAEPAVGLGLCNALDQAVSDLEEPDLFSRIRTQQWAAQAAALADARSRVGACAIAKGGLAASEVADELLLLLAARGAVLLGGAQPGGA